MNLWRVSVSPRCPEYDVHGVAVLGAIHDFGLAHVSGVTSSRLFWLSGSIDSKKAKRIADELLADPVTEVFSYRQGLGDNGTIEDAVVEIHLKPGVMDPTAASMALAIRDMGLSVEQVRTGRRYRIAGVRSADELEFIASRVLANGCIEDVYLTGCGRRDMLPSSLPMTRPYELKLKSVELTALNRGGLATLSREGHLFLSVPEMEAIQAYFRAQGREPTDVELETIAQTWSEHCVHKTLKSEILYEGAPFPGDAQRANVSIEAGDRPGQIRVRYGNLLKETIAEATRRLNKPWCISVFTDNAGIIDFDDDHGVAFKVETHNHPSAIEPYGGAATGIGGVIRDVIGCGLGAKPIANTDVFCFARPDFPMGSLPKGVLHPRRVMQGVVSGVRDYGNRMGIPTVNGAVCFDQRYLGNPLVFCGCVGLIPRRLAFKKTNPGDHVVVVGGRTGRDGIHGATFSSSELTDTHADEFSHAVQIGNAITEKKFLDTLLQARDHAKGCLYSAVTDCGAGGLSSAVGEMGAECGARVHLEKVPLKYTGLRYDEIWISEAQERMVLAVPPANIEALFEVFQAEDVEATDIGEFTDDGLLTLFYDGVQVGQLSMDFLHGGNPRMTKSARWNVGTGKALRSAAGPDDGKPLLEVLKSKLSDINTASKEWVIRQYDHEVQGGSVVKPLWGPGQGPSDAAVLRPKLESRRGIALGCGLCPQLSEEDPYWMAVAAVDEAIRNLVCVGADPARIAILDDFCWPNVDDPTNLGALVRTCQGAYDAAVAYGVPFISGKDSLNNEFAMDPDDIGRLPETLRTAVLPNGRLAIPETLLISAIAVLDDVGHCVTMDLKSPGNSLWFIGSRLGRPLAEQAAVHVAVAQAIHKKLIVSAHDVSDGGMLVAAAEMAIAGRLGLSFADGQGDRTGNSHEQWFGERRLGYMVEVSPASTAALKELLGTRISYEPNVAQITRDPVMRLADEQEVAVETLDEWWRAPLRW